MSNSETAFVENRVEVVSRRMLALRAIEALRAECERRRRSELAWLDDFERMLAELSQPADTPNKTERQRQALTRRDRSVAGKVREAVRDFGERPFSLDDLAGVLEGIYPDISFPRPLLSRRLFDLRVAGEVCLAEAPAEQLLRSRKQRKRLYRLMPPKSEIPAAG